MGGGRKGKITVIACRVLTEAITVPKHKVRSMNLGNPELSDLPKVVQDLLKNLLQNEHSTLSVQKKKKKRKRPALLSRKKKKRHKVAKLRFFVMHVLLLSFYQKIIHGNVNRTGALEENVHSPLRSIFNCSD